MPLQFRTLTALTNGVSRQAPGLRLESQSEEQDNYISDVTKGLVDRPGAEFEAILNATSPGTGAFYHAIDRDSEEQYIVSIPGDGDILVWDLDGAAKTVRESPGAGAIINSGNLQDYLKTWDIKTGLVDATLDARQEFRAHSVVDKTFITNHGIATAMGSTLSDTDRNRAMFWVRATQADWSVSVFMKHDYSEGAGATLAPPNVDWWSGAKPDGSTTPSVMTLAQTLDYLATVDDDNPTLLMTIFSSASVTAPEKYASEVSSAQMMARIVTGFGQIASKHNTEMGVTMNPEGSMEEWDFVEDNPLDAVATDLAGGGAAARGSVFVLEANTSNADNVLFSGSDSLNGTFFKVIHRTVQSLEDLPGAGAPNGFRIKVLEETGDAADDWYVTFNGTTWEEDIGPDVILGFDNTTMPHTLTRESNGEFTFAPAEWDERTAGDEETAIPPDFIGLAINDITVFKGRLCFLFNDGAAFSESGQFFNFWPTTVRQLLPSDPFSLTVDGGSGVPRYHYAVPYDQQLILIGDGTQAVVRGTDTFSASTVSAELATEFEVDNRIGPLLTGRTILLNAPSTQGGSVLEFFPGKTTDSFDGVDITAHIPDYLPTDLSFSAIGRAVNTAVYGSDSNPNNLYVYRYFFDGTGKIQSSWSTWSFGDIEVLGAAFFNTSLYLVVERDHNAVAAQELVKLDFALPQDGNMGYSIRLDEKSSALAGTYNATTNRTPIPVPPVNMVSTDGFIAVLGDLPDRGRVLEIDYGTYPAISIVGEVGAGDIVYFGIPYACEYAPSEFRLKTLTTVGERQVAEPITNVRVQLRRLKVEMSEAGYLRAEVSRDGDVFSESVYTPTRVGGVLEPLVPKSKDDFELFIGSNAREVVVTLVNDTHLPCSINSLSYEAMFHNRTERSR